MLDDKLITFCKQNNFNVHLIAKFYDINNLNDEILKEIESNKTRFISQNIEYAKEILTKNDYISDETKRSLIEVLKLSNFSVVHEPNKIENFDSILSYLTLQQKQLFDYFNIENNNITPPKILNREVSKIANDLVEIMEISKDKPLAKSIDIVEAKLNMITKATIEVKRKFTLTKEDSIFLDELFSDIKNMLEDISSQLINQELETSLLTSNEIINSNENMMEQLVPAQNNIKELEEIKQEIKELKELQLSSFTALDDIDYILKSAKLVTSFQNKNVVKKEVININSKYKLIKVE